MMGFIYPSWKEELEEQVKRYKEECEGRRKECINLYRIKGQLHKLVTHIEGEHEEVVAQLKEKMKELQKENDELKKNIETMKEREYLHEETIRELEKNQADSSSRDKTMMDAIVGEIEKCKERELSVQEQNEKLNLANTQLFEDNRNLANYIKQLQKEVRSLSSMLRANDVAKQYNNSEIQYPLLNDKEAGKSTAKRAKIERVVEENHTKTETEDVEAN